MKSSARTILNLLEKFITSFHSSLGHNYVEVFVNPTRRELQDIGPELRFLIDEEARTIYCWNAYFTTHPEVASHLRNQRFVSPSTLLWGGRGTIGKEGVRVTNIAHWSDTIDDAPASARRIWYEKFSWLHDYGFYVGKGSDK